MSSDSLELENKLLKAKLKELEEAKELKLEKARVRSNKWYAENKDKRKEYRESRDKEQVAKYQKEYFSKPENKEKHKIASKKWASKNKEHLTVYNKNRYEKLKQDPVKLAELKARNKTYAKKFRAKNPNYDKERHVKKNKEKEKEYHTEYYKKNRAKVLARGKVYRAERYFMEKHANEMSIFLESLEQY